MKKPRVSIGLPFFNPGRQLIDAVKSVFAQSCHDWELLLVDDGSTDVSKDFASKISDPRVRLFSDGTNIGLSARLNQIASESRASILFRMDADDLMHPDRVKTCVEILENDPQCDLVSTSAVVIDGRQVPFGIRGFRMTHRPDPYELLKTGVIVHPTIAARTKWFLSNPYDPNYLRAEDRELFVRTLNRTNYFHVNEPLYFYFCVGNIRPTAYLASYTTERAILRSYGERTIGQTKTTFLYVRSLAKSLVLRLLSLFSLQNRLVKQGCVPLSEEQSSSALNALQYVKQVRIPLLE